MERVIGKLATRERRGSCIEERYPYIEEVKGKYLLMELTKQCKRDWMGVHAREDQSLNKGKQESRSDDRNLPIAFI